MDDDARIIEWVDANVGGTVVAIRRQPRWRPVWLVDVERDGDTLELMVRGDRTDAAPLFPLEHEMRFQQLLEEAGIPVPHVYGWSDEPRAFVTDRVPGDPHFDAATDAERAAVMDEYMGILARIHALEVEPFARIVASCGRRRRASRDRSAWACTSAGTGARSSAPTRSSSSASVGSRATRCPAMIASRWWCGTPGSSTISTAGSPRCSTSSSATSATR